MINEKIRDGILACRATGLFNMFSTREVQRWAYENGYFELVCFIEDSPQEYAQFILTGKSE